MEYFVDLTESEALDAILEKIPDEPEAPTAEPSAPETASEQAPQQETTETVEQERVEPEATPAIEPPPTWKAELKAKWQSLPHDLQRDLAQWETERNQGFNSKLNESAEAKKSYETKTAEAEQERQRYASQLNSVIQQAIQLDPVLSHTAKMTPADWEKLWTENPAQAGYLKHQAEQRFATINAWQQEQARLAQAQAKTIEDRESKALAEKVDEWRDEAKRPEFKASIVKTLQSYGYKPEELSALLDHRSVLVARDAMLYRQMMAARQTAQTKREPAPAPKVVKPGSAQNSRGDAQQIAALKQRAIRSGKDADVFAAIMASTKDMRE